MVVLALFAASALAFSEPTDLGVVQAIVVQGAWRSSVAWMVRTSGLSVGSRVTADDLTEARRQLAETKLFDAVECTYSDQDGTVVIAVKEKLNVLVVPYNVGFSANEYGGGLIVTDTNFLGEAKVFSLGASLSNLGPSGIVSFVDHRFLQTSLSLVTTLEGGIKNRSVNDMERHEIQNYDYEKVVFDTRLAVPMAPSMVVTPGFQGLYIRQEGEDAEGSVLAIPSLAVLYDATGRDRYFLAGLWLALSYSYGVSVGPTPSFQSLAGRVNYAHDLLGLGFAEWGAAGQVSNKASLLQSAVSGKGFRTLPPASYSPLNLGGFAELNVPFLRFSWGTFALGAFYEAGWYRYEGRIAASEQPFYGPGFGLYMFLSQIPVPAVHLDLAYNQPAAAWNFALVVGLKLE